MANLDEKQISQTGNDEGASKAPNLDEFVSLLPELYYGVNRLLEESTGALFSRKVGVALWALDGSTKNQDALGSYLTTADLVATFRDWFVVTDEGASSVVSKVKRDLFDLQYIKIEGGSDHIHLTEKGHQMVQEMITRARTVIGSTVEALNPEEQRYLLDFALRMIGRSKKKGPATDFLR